MENLNNKFRVSFFIILTFFTSISATTFAYDADTNKTIHYYSQNDKSNIEALSYTKTEHSLCRYLALRDIPTLIKKHVHGNKALEYGCGTGLSIMLLQNNGFEVIGVDISKEMIQQAALQCPNAPLHLINKGSIPCDDAFFDLVFSGFVLFEIGSEYDMLAYLKEVHRLLKKEGIFIAVTGSEHVYSKNWLILDNDYPKNKNLKSGDLAKSYVPDVDMIFFDYYWTEADYRHFFASAGLRIIEIHYPLAKNEPIAWKDEKTFSPYVIFVAEKM